MIRIIITLLFILLNWLAIAQEMTLKDCISYALQNNLSYTNKNIEASISKENYRQAKRELLPSLSAGSRGNILFGKSIDPTTNDFVENMQIFSMNFYLSSQMSIFEGFTRLNTIKYQKLRHLMSLEEVRQQEKDLTFEIMNKYYDVLYFQNLSEIVNEQVKLTNLNVTKTQKLIDLGIKAESDLLEMEAQAASEIHNQLTVTNKLEDALLQLKSLMNYPTEQQLTIAPQALLSIDKSNLKTKNIYQTALEQMPTVKRAQIEVLASRKNLAIARGKLAPRIHLGGQYSTNYADSRKQQEAPHSTIPFKDQWSQNESQSVYVNLSIPIFSRWGNRSEIKKAKLEKSLAENREQEAKQNLHQQITQDMQQLNAYSKEAKQLSAKGKALRKAYVIAEKKLEQGLIGVIEFYTAKNQLANAEADLLRTQLQLKIKEKTIDFYLGKAIY